MTLHIPKKSWLFIRFLNVASPLLMVLGVLLVYSGLFRGLPGIGLMLCSPVAFWVARSLSAKLLCCPVCKAALPHKKAGRAFITHLEDVPAFCQRCGQKLHIELE